MVSEHRPVHFHHEIDRHVGDALPITAPRLDVNLKLRLVLCPKPPQTLNRRHILKRYAKIINVKVVTAPPRSLTSDSCIHWRCFVHVGWQSYKCCPNVPTVHGNTRDIV